MHEVSRRLLDYWRRLIRLIEPGRGVHAPVPDDLPPVEILGGRISWDEYRRFVARALGEAGGMAEVRRLMMSNGLVLEPFRGWRYLRTPAGWLIPPQWLYGLMARWIGPALFSHLEFHTRLPEQAGEGRLEFQIRIPAQSDDCPATLELAEAVLTIAPWLIGLPAATVRAGVHQRLGIYMLELPESRTLAARVRRIARSLSASLGYTETMETQQAELRHLVSEMEAERDNLNLLIAGLPIGVVIHSEGQVIFTNRPFRQMLWKCGQIPAETPCLDRLLTAETGAGAGRRLMMEDGRILEVAARSRLSYQGRPAELIELQDITALQRVEDRITEAEAKVREKLAHDLHDGLGQYFAALNYKASLATVSPPKERRRAASEIAEMVRKAAAISRDVANGMNPDYAEAGNLTDTLRAACERIGQLFPVAISFRCVALERRQIHTSAAAAGEIIFLVQEALTNAVRHAEPRRVGLELRRGKSGWEIVIEDDGRGFDQAAVLQPGGRQGLGLEAMRLRAGRLGGSLSIVSPVSCKGRGTCICLELPWALLRESPLPNAPPAGRAAPASTLQEESEVRGCLRVFLLDDHAIIRKGIRQIIEADPRFIVCGEAGDPAEVEAGLKESGANVQVADWLLGSGFSEALLLRLRERFPRLFIVTLTMFDTPAHRRRAFEAGADAYVHKSEPPERLLAVLAQPLEEKR